MMVDKGRSGGRITVILVLTHTKYFIPSLLGFYLLSAAAERSIFLVSLVCGILQFLSLY